MTGLARVIESLFPDGVGTAAITIGAAPDPMPDEQPAIARAVPHRRIEFAAGRAAARAAMRQAGLAPASIPMAADRSPRWPGGVAGSITHSEDMALAVAAPLTVAGALGLDAEPDMALPDDLLAEICDDAECRWISGQTEPLRWARLIFVAKEAAFKCQYPASGALFGFDAMRVEVDPDGAGLTARLLRAVPPFAKGHRFAGRYARSAGLVLAGFATAPQGAAGAS